MVGEQGRRQAYRKRVPRGQVNRDGAAYGLAIQYLHTLTSAHVPSFRIYAAV